MKNKKDKYLLCFVQEIYKNQDPKYKDWIAGRMEVRANDNSLSVINEIRFCTPKNKKWVKFFNLYDAKWLDKMIVDKVAKTIKEKFYIVEDK